MLQTYNIGRLKKYYLCFIHIYIYTYKYQKSFGIMLIIVIVEVVFIICCINCAIVLIFCLYFVFFIFWEGITKQGRNRKKITKLMNSLRDVKELIYNFDFDCGIIMSCHQAGLSKAPSLVIKTF